MASISASNNRIIGALVVAALCLLSSTMVLSEDYCQRKDANIEQLVATNTSSGLVRFEQFKVLFHKSYKTVSEELWRRTLFMASLFRAIISQMKFGCQQASAYEEINHMSDWTEHEFRSIWMNESEYLEGNDNEAVAEALKKVGEIGSKLLSSAGDMLIMYGRFQAKILEYGYSALMMPTPEYRPDLPDELFIDYRKDACLNEIRNQGKCGSCYSFSTMALYAWAYCNATQSKIEFSEKFIVDCGHRASLNGCRGGTEPYVANFVNKFGLELLANYQYTDRQDKCPYDATKTQPKEMGSTRLDNPALRLVLPSRFEEELKNGPLIVGLYISEMMHQYGGGLDDGAGCEKIKNRMSLHSVLLVGHGRQEGHEYWLIRNSYGKNWGESGYYKLRKDSRCICLICFGKAIKALSYGTNSLKFYENPDYDTNILARRLITQD